ncbi:ribonuclease J [Candidatus Phytoplasma pini]|uniref:Zn-dependent hydrolase n=1 Tax=Candidatus Phytoplasma pini TaxID=267362 RepID=A0A559KJF2_9MOLU|nr:ribonuclease J [Candidatus Phytoplasma pini]TVY12263.1 Zn-dependent hydrolase [Candidatus Phytoplasma pini]
MHKDINFFALGGIGENGKNFYLLKIKSSYFILDTGLKYPNDSVLGIDFIISDYTCLENIKDQIKAIFITSAFETHSGAFDYLAHYFKVPVYGTEFIINVLKTNCLKNNLEISKINLEIINESSELNFIDTKVSFFNIAHFLPESFGIAFDTEQGLIFYISEMYFLQSKNKQFQTNYAYLASLSQKKKTLALISSSQGAFNINPQKKETVLEYEFSSYLTNIQNNIIISFLIPDLVKIQLVINLAVELNLKIAILGRKSESIVNVALRKGYLKIPYGFLVNLKTSTNYIKYTNLVVIIVGKRFEPFYRLQRICKQTDRLMKLHPKDKILLLSIESSGVDKIQSKTLDLLARNGFDVDILIKDLFKVSYNYEENLKLLLHLLEPKFFLPIIGEYRHQFQIKKIAENFNYAKENIFLFENGDKWIYDFKNKPYIQKGFLKKLGEILIDGTPVLEGNEYILRDRELLANDGVIIIACNIDLKFKKNVGNIEIVSKGFLDSPQVEIILNKLKEIFLDLNNQFLQNNSNLKLSDFKNDLREHISKFVFKETKKKPIIIPVLIVSNY